MKHNLSPLQQSLLNNAIGILFQFDEWWFGFFYSHKGGGLRLCPEELIEESHCFSRSEQLLVRVALDLWADENRVSISEILRVADYETFNRILLAIMAARELSITGLNDAQVVR